MIVDLNPLPYRMAIELINYCVANNISTDQCNKLLTAISTPVADRKEVIVWEIDVPDDVLTYFMLKWR